MEEPVPTSVPPQLPVYHIQLAPVPRLPPETLSVLVFPGVIVDGLAVAEVAETDVVFTLTVLLTHEVVLQVPSALT
jgi:hypothetical protein